MYTVLDGDSLPAFPADTARFGYEVYQKVSHRFVEIHDFTNLFSLEQEEPLHVRKRVSYIPAESG
jgi:hypothetical protein